MTETEKMLEEKITKAKHIVVDALDGTKPPYDKQRRYIRYKDLSEILHLFYNEWMVSDYENYEEFLAKEAGM